MVSSSSYQAEKLEVFFEFLVGIILKESRLRLPGQNTQGEVRVKDERNTNLMGPTCPFACTVYYSVMHCLGT